MQAAKIDYVRFRLSFDAQQSGPEKVELEEVAELFRAKHGLTGKCYDVSDYFDKALHQRVLFFNAWGVVAEEMYHHLSSAWLFRLMRLDVRHGLDDAKIDFRAVYDMAEARAGAKYTVHRFKSPYKQKRQGRDAGGQGIVIGGQGAARRVSLYQRSNEGPAWEYQFSGKPLYMLIADLKANGTSGDHSFADELKARVLQDGVKYGTARLGASPEDIERGIVSTAPVNDYTNPEEVLDRIEQLWFVLPTEAQEAFLDTHAGLEPVEVAKLGDAMQMLDEAQWQEDEDHAYPIADEYADELLESAPEEELDGGLLNTEDRRAAYLKGWQ